MADSRQTMRAVDYVRNVSRQQGEEQAPAGDLVIHPSRTTGLPPIPKGKVSLDPELFGEIGTSGLRQYGGFVLEEWLLQLQGRNAAWAYREVMDNSPIVAAILFAIDWLARQVEWRVEKGKDSEAQEFVESCMHDMSHTWGDTISEALSMLPYGWAMLETVYKVRQGDQPGPSIFEQSVLEDAAAQTSEDNSHPGSSKFKDGKIGWRKMPVRAQETLLRWHFDGYSGLRAMEQIDWHGGNHSIPIQKALLFRCRPRRNNPEGYSILRGAWTSYYSLKRIQAIEAIGIERDLAGIPMITPPEGVDLFAPGYATLLGKVQQMVQSVRRDEYEGLVMPGYGWEFKLVSAGGSRQIATDPVIRRYEQRMATSMLADFVLIGQDAVGSYAMVDVKSDLFGMAMDGILDLICETFNRYAIPRLLKLNGMDSSDPPKIKHGSAGRIDLQKVGQFLELLSAAGAPIPWSNELLQQLFTQAALPADFDGQKPLEASQDIHGVTPGNLSPPPPPPPGMLPGAPGGAPGTPQPRPQLPPGKPPAGVQKADGRVIPMGARLGERHMVLSSQLERDVHHTLRRLGDDAATAYLSHVGKAAKPNIDRLVAKVLKAMNVQQWVRTRLLPLLRNHAGRVEMDTQRLVQQVLGREAHIGTEDAEKIAAAAGQHLAARDIEPQVREALRQVIQEAQDTGEPNTATADRLRLRVPQGSFTGAGVGYRSRLIAEDQTAQMQRSSALAAYRSHPDVDEVVIRDGVYGPPRSDGACVARDGDSVPLSDVETVHPNHPNCTLSFDPVVKDGET